MSYGSAKIIKTSEDGVVSGITFTVVGEGVKATGSFDAASESERDTLICDKNGFAQSKDLPYGVYTVHQVSGWEGREMMKDFDVFISQNGETYRYLINNANFRWAMIRDPLIPVPKGRCSMWTTFVDTASYWENVRWLKETVSKLMEVMYP